MGGISISRSSHYALQFERAHDIFVAVVASLTPEQWKLRGLNYPQRINDEDEARSVAVIAQHVAEAEKLMIDRIEGLIQGQPLPSIDFKTINAAQATRHASVTQDDVLNLLRANRASIAERIAAIPEEELDILRDTPVGPMSVATRLERVVIGHIQQHTGSIESAIRQGR